MAWKFHYDVWNGITVMVMPLRKNFVRIVDSNVGVVHHCEHLGAMVSPDKFEHMDNATVDENNLMKCAVCGAIPASVITKDGKKPDCEFRALAEIVGGEAALQILNGEKQKPAR